jgi:four helix bundle protein
VEDRSVSRVERFEDLVAWQKARVWVQEIYSVTLKSDLARDFSLRNQLRGAAISIMGNIAEGFERSRLREFHQFVSIAKGSCAEVRSHLYVALDAGYIDPADFNRLTSLGKEIGRILGGLRASLQRELQAEEC